MLNLSNRMEYKLIRWELMTKQEKMMHSEVKKKQEEWKRKTEKN